MNTSSTSRRVKIATSVFAGLVIACTAASAEAGVHVHQGAAPNKIVVDYSDLDLTNQTGLKTLYARLKYAAERACGSAPESHSLDAKVGFEHCYDQALNNAVVRVNDATLTAMHNRATRKSSVT